MNENIYARCVIQIYLTNIVLGIPQSVIPSGKHVRAMNTGTEGVMIGYYCNLSIIF